MGEVVGSSVHSDGWYDSASHRGRQSAAVDQMVFLSPSSFIAFVKCRVEESKE